MIEATTGFNDHCKTNVLWAVELSERCAKRNWDGKRAAGAKALVMSGLYGPTKVVP